METIKKVSVNGQVYNLGGSSAVEPIEITYSELKALKDSSGLVIGTKYKIIDYETIFKIYTNSDNVQNFKSAGHVFDLTVTAETANSFYPIARASKRAGDDYFSSCDLSLWVIYYCFDNNSTKYPVDSSCKGFIYRMIDEYNNDATFDFKNLLFSVSSNTVHNISDQDPINAGEEAYSYFYLFSKIEGTSLENLKNPTDGSITGLASNNKIIFNNFSSIGTNHVGCVLAAIKGSIAFSTKDAIINNYINSGKTFLFSTFSISYGDIKNNFIEGNFIVQNIASQISSNKVNASAELCVGIQNWESGNYSDVMGSVSNNFLYPGSYFLSYGSKKNGIAFSDNVINTRSLSRINSDYNIIKCNIEGVFPDGKESILDSAQENKYILGNGTATIRVIDKYNLGQ